MIDVTEDRELRPTGAYGISKAEAEGAVRDACARTGLEAWILRPTTVYGPEDRLFACVERLAARRMLAVDRVQQRQVDRLDGRADPGQRPPVFRAAHGGRVGEIDSRRG